MKILWFIGLLVVGAWARPEADPTGDPNRNSEDASRAFIPHDWINIDGIGVSRCTQVGDMYVARSWGECHICGCFPSYNGIYAKCAPCRACISGTVPIPIPAPVPQPWPVPIEEPWPTPIPQPWPVPIPEPRPIPIPEPINPICPPPVIIPGPPRPYPVPVPVPGKNVLVPVPVPIPSQPEKIYVQGPSVPVPVPVETRVPYPVAVDRPYPVRSPPQIIPIPFPEPVPGPEVEVPVPVPVPSPPIRVPYPVNRYIPVPGPEKLVPVPVPVPVDNPKYYPVPVIYYVSPICRNHRPLEPFTIPGEPCHVYVCKVQYHYVYVDTVTLPYCDTPAYGPFIGGYNTGYRGAEANALANAISLGGGNAIANADANAIAGGFGGLGGLGGPGGLGGFGGYGGAEANALANAVSLGGGNAYSNAEANAIAGGYGGLGSLGGFPGYGGSPGYEGYPGFRGTEANALANAVSIGSGNAYSNAEANALSGGYGGYGGLGGIGGLGDLGGLGGFGGYGGAEANALANAVSLGGGNAFSNAEANALAGGYGSPSSLGGFPGYGGLPGYDSYPGLRGTEANALANAVSIGGGNAYSNAEANALASGYGGGGLGGLGGFGGHGGLGGFYRDAEANAQANALSSGGGNSFANAAANALSSGNGGNPFSSYSPFIGAIRSGHDTEGLLNTFTDLNVELQESDNIRPGRIHRDGITTDSLGELKSSRVEQENDNSKRKRIYRRGISDAEALANAKSLRYGNELIEDDIDILTNAPLLGVYKGGITNANAIHLPFLDLSQAQSVGPKGISNSNSLFALHRGYYRDASNLGQTQEQFSNADAQIQAIEANIRQAEAVINADSRGLQKSSAKAKAQAEIIANSWKKYLGSRNSKSDAESDAESRYWSGHSNAKALANAVSGGYGGLYGRQNEISDDTSDSNSRYWNGLNNWNGLSGLGGLSTGYSSVNAQANAIAGGYRGLYGRQEETADDISDTNSRYWNGLNYWNRLNGLGGSQSSASAQANAIAGGNRGLYGRQEETADDISETSSRYWNGLNYMNGFSGLGGSQSSANAQANAIAGGYRGLYGRQDESDDDVSEINSRYWNGLNYWNGLRGLGGSQSSANAQANAIAGGYGGLYGRQDDSDDDVSETNSRYWNGFNNWNGLSGLGSSQSSANAQANANAGAYGGLFGRQEKIADTVRSEQLRQSDANSRYLNRLGGGYSSANDIADAGIFSGLLGRQDINAKDRSIRSIVKSQGSKNSELESDANGRYWPRYYGYNGYDGYMPPYTGYNGYDGYDAYRPSYINNYRLPYYGGYNELPYGGYPYRGLYGRQEETADDISDINSRYWNGLNNWNGINSLGGSQSSANAQANAIAGGYGGLYGRQDESDDDMSESNSRYWNRLNYWNGLGGLGGSQNSANAQASAIAGGYRGRYGREEETADDISDTNSRYWNRLNYWNGLRGLGGSQSSASAQANAIAGGNRGLYGRQEESADDISDTNSRYWNGLNYWNGLSSLGGSHSSANAQANAIAGGYGGLYGRQDESDDDVSETNSRYWNGLNYWNGLSGLGGSHNSANAQANANAGAYGGLFGRQEKIADAVRSEQLKQSDASSRYWNKSGGGYGSANDIADTGTFSGLLGRQDINAKDRTIRSIVKSQGSKNSELESDANGRYWPSYNGYNGYDGYVPPYIGYNGYDEYDAYRPPYVSNYRLPYYGGYNELPYGGYNGYPYDNYNSGYLNPGLWNPYKIYRSEKDDPNTRQINRNAIKNIAQSLGGSSQNRVHSQANAIAGGNRGLYGRQEETADDISDINSRYWNGLNNWNGFNGLGGSHSSANAQANAIAGGYGGLYGRQDESDDDVSETNSRYWNGLNYWNGLRGLGGSQSSANAQANAIAGGYGGLYGRQDDSDDDVSETNSRYWNGFNNWNGLSGLGSSQSSANAQANANAGAYGGLFGRQEKIVDTVRSEQLRQSDANSRYLNRLGGGYSSANDIADAGILTGLLGRQDINAKDRSIRSIVKSQESKNSELESDANGRYWPRYYGYNGYDGYMPPYTGYNGYDEYDAYRPPYVSNYRLPYYGGYNELPYGGYNGYPYDNYNGGYLNPGLWNPYEIYRSEKDDPNTRQINRSAIKNIAQSFSALSLSD